MKTLLFLTVGTFRISHEYLQISQKKKTLKT